MSQGLLVVNIIYWLWIVEATQNNFYFECVLWRHTAESPAYKGSCVHAGLSQRSAFMHWSPRCKQVHLLSFVFGEINFWPNVIYVFLTKMCISVDMAWTPCIVPPSSGLIHDHHTHKLKWFHIPERQAGSTAAECRTWLESSTQAGTECQAKLQIAQRSLY